MTMTKKGAKGEKISATDSAAGWIPEPGRTEHTSFHKLCMKLWLAVQVSIFGSTGRNVCTHSLWILTMCVNYLRKAVRLLQLNPYKWRE